MQYSVAVIIPTLNEEKFIAKCLESVRKQSFPFEQMDIMVVDGGSSDNTCKIVESYIDSYSNIRLLHNPQRIQSAAFNLGCKNTDASYLIRLDAHALYDSYYIEKCILALQSNDNIGNAGGRCEILSPAEGLIPEANAIINKSRFGIGGATFRVGGQPGYVDTVPFGAFPRKIVEELGGMREDFPRGEDNEYNFRIRSAGYKIFFDPSIISTYFARPTLLSSMKQMYQNGLSIAKLINLNKSIISIRHLIPLLFVLSLLFLIVGSFFWKPFLLLLSGEILVYFFVAIISAFSLSRHYGWKYFMILPIMFFLIHCSYGYGTLRGLLELFIRI